MTENKPSYQVIGVATYLKLTGCKLGLLMDFNTEVIRDGIKRIANGLPEEE